MLNNKIDSSNMGFLLSIVVITYNHEKYIRKCLDSILMQDVDFSFEIIISDDLSTDQTAQIITEYQDKYPDIIKPNLRTINVGASKNQYDCFLMCTGKYIAILDGDDFWIDKLKLKIQIDFLKNNDTFIACTQRYSVVDENNNVVDIDSDNAVSFLPNDFDTNGKPENYYTFASLLRNKTNLSGVLAYQYWQPKWQQISPKNDIIEGFNYTLVFLVIPLLECKGFNY